MSEESTGWWIVAFASVVGILLSAALNRSMIWAPCLLLAWAVFGIMKNRKK